MQSLFFVVSRASSSGAEGPYGLERLALLPGVGDAWSTGWRSARCCDFPQEVLLQLETGAEIRELELVAPLALAPEAVDVYLSNPTSGTTARSRSPVGLASAVAAAVLPDLRHVGTIRFERAPNGSAETKGRLEVAEICSGQIRLRIQQPIEVGASNPYRQVGLARVEIWGYELSAYSTRGIAPKAAPAARADQVATNSDDSDIARVLLDLGISLDIIPVDEDSVRGQRLVDAETRDLMDELKKLRKPLLSSYRFGEAQQVTDSLHRLSDIGAELQRLYVDRDRLSTAKLFQQSIALAAPITKLESQRMAIAAFHETRFWLKSMVMDHKAAAVLADGSEP